MAQLPCEGEVAEIGNGCPKTDSEGSQKPVR